MSDKRPFDQEKTRAAASEARASAQKPCESPLFRALPATGAQRDAILKRAEEMPSHCRNTYLRAMSGKSRNAGIRAFCRMCLGWLSKSQITDCSDPSCPLYCYRPFQTK